MKNYHIYYLTVVKPMVMFDKNCMKVGKSVIFRIKSKMGNLLGSRI